MDKYYNEQLEKRYREAGIVRDPSEAYNLPAKGPYTIEDYYAIPDERRVELIDGVIYDMASATRTHQRIIGLMYRQMIDCIEEHDRNCEVFFAPSDVQLDRDIWTMVQPDLFVVCEPTEPGEHAHQGAPAFVAEVLSPSNRAHDLIRKLYKYKNAGVKEYWVIDPENRVVLVYDFENAKPVQEYTFQDRIPIRISEGSCEVNFPEIDRSVAKYGYQ
ncbi:MAG: Uma2 family endonuclease [Eubacterium sp.]|nr:Uma2 family endonuclease [Eubacterium sp.]